MSSKKPQKTASEDKSRRQNTKPMNPGDDAQSGTAGTGEDLCPQCRGTGRLQGTMCSNCGGTGRIVEGIGGA